MKIDRVFNKLSNMMPFMMAYIDKERRYVYVNKRYEDFFGIALGDVKGKTLLEVVGEASYKKITSVHNRVLQGEDLSIQDSVTLSDGRRLKLDIKYVPNTNTRTNAVEGFFAIIHDITPYASVTEVLRAVHDVMNRQTNVLSTGRIDNLLKLGCHYLDTQIGLVSRVIDNDYTVKYSYSTGEEVPADTTFDLGNTYCSVTLQANDVVATRNASGSTEFKGHPCFQAFQLETYLGLPIIVNGKVWGTLSFSSSEQRTAPFTELDKELMGLICSAIETVIISNSKTTRLERLAYTDFLTGLSNRLYITEQLERIAELPVKDNHICCFALIDIDHFKAVNDTHGHDAGDEVLQMVASRISDAVRTSDICSRVGGEEFALVLTGLTRAKANEVLNRIREIIEALQIEIRETITVSVTVSLGVTELTKEDNFNHAYKRADIALYSSKKEGRNRLTWN